MAAVKPQFTPHYTEELDAHDAAVRKSVNKRRTIDSIRLGLTVLSLLLGLTTIGTTADALAVFNRSHVSEDFLLPLWPANFDIGPSIAVMTAGSVVIVASAISILASKVPAVSPSSQPIQLSFLNKVPQLRLKTLVHTTLTFLAPIASLIAAIVATSLFYAVNASTTVDTLQSWSCSWAKVSMSNEPHFSALCKQSKTALYLTIAIIPLQVIVLGLAAIRTVAENKAIAAAEIDIEERKGSPDGVFYEE
ncbi:MAG: hypothetical protein M1818_004736 [Claussenomyces sp. TS43310]|nr:MAG: hypothetical protein M1818_004736 [Claussenomyces sp. TS43310]